MRTQHFLFWGAGGAGEQAGAQGRVTALAVTLSQNCVLD